MPQNVETNLHKLHTSNSVRANAWVALPDDAKVVGQRLRSVKGLTDNTFGAWTPSWTSRSLLE
jgi:hypothetical protein